MRDKSIDTILGYVVIAVIGYFVVKDFYPLLIVGVIGLLGLRYLNHKK